MTDSSIIQQARDVLKRWREEATDGAWKVYHSQYAGMDEADVVVDDQSAYEGVRPIRSNGGYAEYDGTMSCADARLIVGTAGNPDLLDALEALLQMAQREAEFFGGVYSTFGHQAERIAAAIIAADERMTS